MAPKAQGHHHSSGVSYSPSVLGASVNILQTLDRGLEALELISTRPGGVSPQELADRLGAHRAVAYRILATLELRHMAVKGEDGRFRLGSGILAVTDRYLAQCRTSAQPLLEELAEATGLTSFLAVAEHGQAVAVAVAEPNLATFGISYGVGSRHSLTQGAAGVAILALRPALPGDPAAVSEARERGVAVTHGELQRGTVGMAVGLDISPPGALEASVGVVALGDLDVNHVLPRIQQVRLRLSNTR